MVNVQIAKVCGLCAGCIRAIRTTEDEIKKGEKVTIFKEIVHNKNVNGYLASIGAICEEDIDKLPKNNTVIIRAHGEPPKTYEFLKENNIKYIDCTCPNVTEIHNKVKQYSDMGYKIIILGKHNGKMHPEVLGTIGWAGTEVVVIEDKTELGKLNYYKNDKLYLVCQTTFNMVKADVLIKKIKEIANKNMCELIINKSLCNAQQAINNSSAELALDCDVMIVVGGANSSNSLELYNNVSTFCPSIFIEDIHTYKEALKEKNIEIKPNFKVGITAGASTRKEELIELKNLIESDWEIKIN